MMRAGLKLFLVLLVLLAVPVALSQKAALPKYDLNGEFSFSGIVDEIKEVPGACGGEDALDLVIRTDSGLIEVQIGPSSFLKDLEITFNKGVRVQIKGARPLEAKEGDVVLAREVQQDGDTLVMRDKKGEPVWTWMKKG